jgi:DNA-binding transcriptional regulator YdaS (Cro superfamily)
VGQFHAVPLTFLGPLPLASVSAAPGSAAVLNSATLAPLSLSQVSSAMVRTAAADSESAARLGPVTPEQARPAIDPASMVTLLTASAEMPPQEVGAAGSEEPEGAQIIAFVCRKLPRSPNPDPKLDWPSKPHGGKRDRD